MPSWVWLAVTLGAWAPPPCGEFVVEGAFERIVEFEQVHYVESESGEGYVVDLDARFAMPLDGPGQRFRGGLVDTDAETVFDAHRNAVARFRRAELHPGEEVVSRWKGVAVIGDRRHRVDRRGLLPLTAIPGPVARRYLRDGERYGLHDARLRDVAARARAEATDALDLAWRLNEAVRARLAYKRDGRWDPAPKVWETGEGSCSEYHFVFAALCRLAGLPCRFVGATAFRAAEETEEYVDTVYHRWSEVWLPGYGWFPVDVSRNDAEDGEKINAAFGRTSRRLLVLSVGDGGDHELLGWSYFAETRHRARGDGALRVRRRVRWLKSDPDADAPTASADSRPAAPAAAPR
ncbi:MAG TPA: transglutaminase domain-containing protein [Planctomycetota bacterium]|nr:transglutaminase domain-containing protein [Planctomycetota bacterium]